LILDNLLDLKADGSFRMDMSYFNYCEGLTMTSQKFHDLFGGRPRKSGAPLTKRDMDIAASVQRVTEEIVLRIAKHVHAETGMSKLCLAGGVALNCVANGRVLREGPFDDIWIQPAAGDAGGALGAALFIWYQLLGNVRSPAASDDQHGSLLGPTFSDEDIRSYLDSVGSVYHHIANDGALCEDIARRIADGKVIGWFQGAMEFGPRALGARSILGDARSPAMQAVMNLKVKFRESFRPFAPAVLREHASEYFGTPEGLDSPYMLLVAPVIESRRRHVGEDEAHRTGLDKLSVHRSEIPAATHVDYSARIQTVDRERHGLYHGVIDAFYRQTGCPVVVNTSFNLGWDPIVCTPKEAYHTFMSSDIDVLCMGHYVLAKAEQPAERHALALPGVRAYTSEPWCCPCGQDAALVAHEGGLRCSACDHQFVITDGIPQLFWPHEKFGANTDVTEAVKAFYEETPFPNYDEHDSVRSLIDKSRRGIYAHMLNEGLPFNGRILEVGCGTGQLTNFLGISCREVIGVDLCLNSLRLAEQFRSEHGLERVRFAQMNLFRPTFTREQFDVILCNGVLHHTADPYGGFKGLVPLLKPGGYIIIGLYNKYGRLMTDLRRAIFRMTGGRATWLDPYLRSTKMSREKRRAWFADQYQHPHESKHTIGEVLDWFDETGLNFVRGIPSTTGSPSGDDLFAPEPPGSALNHATVQAKQIITGSREGGFFLMIGRKPEHADAALGLEDGKSNVIRPDGRKANTARQGDTVRRAS
jgi:SAM-dependent methyltransferase